MKLSDIFICGDSKRALQNLTREQVGSRADRRNRNMVASGAVMLITGYAATSGELNAAVQISSTIVAALSGLNALREGFNSYATTSEIERRNKIDRKKFLKPDDLSRF